MGFFNDLKRKKIRSDQKPFFKQKNKKENHIDLHLELTKKIDDVISKNNQDQEISENKKISIPEFIELRQPFARSPEIPVFQTGLGPRSEIGELDSVQEFFEIDPPTNFLMEKQPENKDEFKSWMANNQNEKDQKTFWAFGPLKAEKKAGKPEKTTTKNNRNHNSNNNNNDNDETTVAKIELEQTKKEIERKKKELEEAIKKQREKELEVKIEEEERRKQEKLIKLELKKQLKEEKIKEKLEKKAQIEQEKLAKKAQIEREIELKKLAELKKKEELMKQIELKKQMELRKKEELMKQIELKKQVELRKKEELLKQLELKKQEMIKSKVQEEELLKEEKITPDTNDIVEEEKQVTPEDITWDEDIAKLLPILDSLFEKLPEDVVDEFTSSEYFELYEKVLLKYKNK